LTPEDLKEYENLQETIPIADVLKEIDEIIRRDELRGIKG